ncbi:MAG: hypothetical protein QME32_00205 [Endomicrobiia bacterium]|nr:hypothetical protein [Endomicrobiia bacterium]
MIPNIRMLVWSLRPDLVIRIELPMDLNRNDITRLKKLIDLEAELISEQDRIDEQCLTGNMTENYV